MHTDTERLKQLAPHDAHAAAALLHVAKRSADVEAFTILARAAAAREDIEQLRVIGRWFLDANIKRKTKWQSEPTPENNVFPSGLIPDPRFCMRRHLGYEDQVVNSRVVLGTKLFVGSKKRWLCMAGGNAMGNPSTRPECLPYTRLECLWSPAIARELAHEMTRSVRWLTMDLAHWCVGRYSHFESDLDDTINLSRNAPFNNGFYELFDVMQAAAGSLLDLTQRIENNPAFTHAVHAVKAFVSVTHSDAFEALGGVYESIRPLYFLSPEEAPSTHMRALYKQNLTTLHAEHAELLIQYYLGEKTPE